MLFQDTDSSAVKAWGSLARVFHWSLAFLLLFTFITGNHWLNQHVKAGDTASLSIAAVFVSGVLVSLVAEGKNQIKAMVTGRKKYHSYLEDVHSGKRKEKQS